MYKEFFITDGDRVIKVAVLNDDITVSTFKNKDVLLSVFLYTMSDVNIFKDVEDLIRDLWLPSRIKYNFYSEFYKFLEDLYKISYNTL